MAGGHAWWWGGACVVGGGACMAGDTATALGGTHPTGMHSCILGLRLLPKQYRLDCHAVDLFLGNFNT